MHRETSKATSPVVPAAAAMAGDPPFAGQLAIAQDALQKGHSVRFSTLANTLADLLEQESLPAV